MINQFSSCPIIIGGCGRSGTTLLLSILSAHPHIFAIPHETWSFWPTETANEFRELMHAFYNKLREFNIPSMATRWCEKTPKNIRVFDRFLEFFGHDVRLIQIVRDGRDVITSRHPHDLSKFWVAPERWINDVKYGLVFEGHPQVLTLRYEDLVLDFNTTLSKICAFIGEDSEPLTKWYENATVRYNDAWKGEIKPLFHGSVGRWKNPEFSETIAKFVEMQEVNPLLKHFGYIS